MPGPHDRPSRVLVGDEEPLVCEFVREALRLSGYDVEVSHDEAEILKRSRDRAFGLLILDFNLASRSGFRGIISLRERVPDVPIILMAAAAGGHAEAEPFAFTYRVQLLRKPFGARSLRDAVDRAMPPEEY